MRDFDDEFVGKIAKRNVGRVKALPRMIVEVLAATLQIYVLAHGVLVATLSHQRVAVMQLYPLQLLVVCSRVFQVQGIADFQPKKYLECELRAHVVKQVERRQDCVF